MGISTFTRFAFNERAQRWYHLPGSGGTGFVAAATVQAEMTLHYEATFGTLEGLTQGLYGGQITLEQWQLGVMGELKDAHAAQAMFARGGRQYMGAEEWGRVGGTLKSEYRYLRQFAQDVAAGKVSEAQALARIKQYGQATQQSYWREWALAVEADESLPLLQQIPGDGKTACRGNCRCTLEQGNGGIMWVLGAEKSCADCPAIAAGGPYRFV